MSHAVPARVDDTPAHPRGTRQPRLRGIDLARTAAVVGMVGTHLNVRYVDEPWGDLGWVVIGRSSALFAVLAGLSIALVTGRSTPLVGSRLHDARISLSVRALLLYLLGLALGTLDSGIAVILPAYGAMFLLAVPLVHLGARALATWAVAWCLVAPWLASPARAWVADPSSPVHSLPDHGGWLATTEQLTLTGFYPVVFWFGYVLAGMALGRLDLTRWTVQRGIALGGVALATGAWLVSRLATAQPWVQHRMLATWNDAPVADFAGLDREARHGLHGQAPADWVWQLTMYPHASTMMDLLHTVGTSMAVIGMGLLVVQAWPRAQRLWVLLGAIGTMSLTAYTLHILVRTFYDGSGDYGVEVFVVHLAVMAAVAVPLVLLGRRGPLEALFSRACRGAAELVTRP
ncbi:heparan-alpha-glucosaminide N-acetyltransferase domain-containing protein [Kytococcus sp. HMSC28H12]|uniref:heparan-alpha-glucosaminide N-acetyltransferase domain-containing protein n=1 Tax=Kytococcus sp. HMSC28H12 TaxID=1581067 RepID=UPI00143B76F7|nr:heparan-alpha-glucosaminide N-acetyltransferase domain-containing protein [Kytococcus sp. HMSC28H12]